MIVQTRENKDLVIPKSLGNFVTEGSGGGMTPEEVEEMIDSAITEYDIEIQVDLEDIREAVSGNSEDISTLSATTEEISQQIVSLSGLTADITAISGQTSANTQDIGILSGATEALSGSVETLSTSLSAYTTNDTFNAGISGLTGQISGVSEDVEELSGKTGEVYDAIFYEEEGETYSQIDDLWGAMDEKQDVLEAGSGISIDNPIISVKSGKGLYFKEDGTMEVKPGSGITFNSDGQVVVRIGEGLGFSGDTLVVSGGTGGGPQVVYLNKLSQQERLDLYDTIWSYYDDSTQSFTSAWTEDLYEFYIDLRDYNDQQAFSTNDHYEGFFPMQVTRCHNSDYGGAVFFDGVEGAREGNGHLITIRFVIAADGSVDAGTWWNSPASEPEYSRWFNITSAGTIANDQDWGGLADESKVGICRMRYEGSSNGEGSPSFGSVKWWRRYKISYNDEAKDYYVWSADVLIEDTVYTGVWGMIQDEWYTASNVPPHLISWTSGATITLPYQPLP